MSPRLWRAGSLGLGWDMQMQPVRPPAPSDAAEQHAASCTHPLTCAGNLKARASPAGLAHVYACVHLTCARNSCRAATFILDALFHLPSFFLSSSLLFPSSSTPLCCFPCLFSSSPPFFSHNFSFLLCPACSDCGWGASREWAQRDAADATAVWAPCLLLGPLRRTKLHVSRGVLRKVRLSLFSRGQLSFPGSGIKWGFERLREQGKN